MKLNKRGIGSIDKFIEVVLVVFIFTALIGTIASQVVSAQGGNLTGGASVLLGLTTLVLVIGFILHIRKSAK